MHDEPRKIVSFRAFDGMTAKPDTPVEVILVIDTVNLSQEQASAAKSAVEKLLRMNHGHLAQPVSVFLLSPTVLSSTLAPSIDGDTLADQVARGNDLPVVRPTEVLKPGQSYRATFGSPGMTPEGRANRISLNPLGSIVIEERRKPGRKVLFWIGPGWPVDKGAAMHLSIPSLNFLPAYARLGSPSGALLRGHSGNRASSIRICSVR